jgi:4-amino-4-deoxy-L-arabinose transferase-like glycosyltransferase
MPDRTFLIVATIVYAIVSTAMSLASRACLEADGVTHYLYARFAFEVPAYFTDVWARPVRMLIHAAPAHFFGLHGVRAASLICAIACAWLTYAIARHLKWPRPGLAGFFVLAQPLFFLHSFSELTEVPFALLAAAAFLCLLRRWWPAFALICGAMPASRPEGLGFVLLAVVMLILHRRWFWLPLVAMPVLVWNTAGWHLSGSDAGPWHRWLIDHVPYSNHSLYPAGRITRFLEVLPSVVSPLVLPAILVGTAGLIRRDDDEPTTPLFRWRLPDAWLIALIPWGMLAVHSILHATGRMSSSGEPRYLLAATPFWALLAARGWTMFAERFQWRHPWRYAAAAACVPIVANVAWRVVPLREQPDAMLAREIVRWYRESGTAASHPKLYATNPLVLFEADQMPGDASRDLVARRPPRCVFVYDSLYASFNADPRMIVTPEAFDAAGWKRSTAHFGLPNQTWIVFESE